MITDEAAQVLTSFYFVPQDGEIWPVTLDEFDAHARATWPGYVACNVRDADLKFTYTRADDGAQRSAWRAPGGPGVMVSDSETEVFWTEFPASPARGPRRPAASIPRPRRRARGGRGARNSAFPSDAFCWASHACPPAQRRNLVSC
ncbi:hypothetical protein LK07_17915 [Streptomyces pluripotens]|uniref:Uncharacterized protein n=1 Tax=Streptomyces pluripotens TaxID=1355015 RepID=A0A221P0B4_9ACTN|nr:MULTISPECIES: hypothetical protein [Streptomyces]ARP71341.1 hypothetical protein LK06_016760 [Streptomyces pluripotens]ASN25592.1 hypothetical protein LK07_17915 [Streptomyces pluripotens]KIE23731.1 hypothetical protein LK08_28535 [Streptomyces sp. MUSC 125]